MKKWTPLILCFMAFASALAASQTATNQDQAGTLKLSKTPSLVLVQPIAPNILSDQQKVWRSFSTATGSKLTAIAEQFLLKNASLPPKTDAQGVVQGEVRKAFPTMGEMDVSEMVFWVMAQATKDAHEDLKEILAQMKLADERKRQIAELKARARARLDAYGSRSSASPSPGVVSPRPGRQIQLNYTRNMRIAYSSVPEVGYTLKEVDAASVTRLVEMEKELSSIGDDAQLANIDLWTALQRQQQMNQTLSNILKKQHDTASAIIANLK